MRNRMLPLGYDTQDGKIIVVDSGAETVKMIFGDYCKGSSFKMLVSTLNATNALFKENATQWNKGRIHHILVDERYLGNNSFPAIIDKVTFDKAQCIMENKRVGKRQISDEIEYLKEKVFCGECGGRFKRVYDSDGKEKWVCINGCKFGRRPTDFTLLTTMQAILDRVRHNPDILNQTPSNTGYKCTQEIMRMTNEMTRLNNQALPSFNMAKTLLFQLASLKFLACKEDKSVYTDYVLEQIGNMNANREMDVEIIRNTVHKVVIKGKDEYGILFINGAMITNKEDGIDASKTGD